MPKAIQHFGNLAFKTCLHSFYVFPLHFLYLIISTPTAIVLQYVLRYRRNIIDNNLRIALSDDKEARLRHIISQNYRHLSDTLVESIKLFSSNKVKGLEFSISNAKIFEDLYDNRQSVFVLTGHIGNWELNLRYAQSFVKHKIVAVYKRQSNAAFNELLETSRSSTGLTLIHEEIFIKRLLMGSDIPTIYLLMADQRPNPHPELKQLEFLNQQTFFSPTIERLAYKYSLPVIYADIAKLGRGKYRAKMIWIWKNIERQIPGYITGRYADLLERNIMANPAIWLWSHDRWKFSRNDD